jgi:hypothetical protein
MIDQKITKIMDISIRILLVVSFLSAIFHLHQTFSQYDANEKWENLLSSGSVIELGEVMVERISCEEKIHRSRDFDQCRIDKPKETKLKRLLARDFKRDFNLPNMNVWTGAKSTGNEGKLRLFDALKLTFELSDEQIYMMGDSSEWHLSLPRDLPGYKLTRTGKNVFLQSTAEDPNILPVRTGYIDSRFVFTKESFQNSRKLEIIVTWGDGSFDGDERGFLDGPSDLPAALVKKNGPVLMEIEVLPSMAHVSANIFITFFWLFSFCLGYFLINNDLRMIYILYSIFQILSFESSLSPGFELAPRFREFFAEKSIKLLVDFANLVFLSLFIAKVTRHSRDGIHRIKKSFAVVFVFLFFLFVLSRDGRFLYVSDLVIQSLGALAGMIIIFTSPDSNRSNFSNLDKAKERIPERNKGFLEPASWAIFVLIFLLPFLSSFVNIIKIYKTDWYFKTQLDAAKVLFYPCLVANTLFWLRQQESKNENAG